MNHEVVLRDEEYDEFMAEVMAVKEKKRSKWHSSILDGNGMSTRVKYADGQLLNWSPLHNTWVTVKPARSIIDRVANIRSPLIKAMVHGDQECFDLMCLAAMHQTGQHHRNHRIRVPVGQDGAVRA